MSDIQEIPPAGTTRWWRRLRRICQIPDLLGDEAARRAMAVKLSEQTRHSPNFAPRVVAADLITAFMSLAEEGALDDLLFDDEPTRAELRPAGLYHDPIEPLLVRGRDIQGGLGPQTEEAGNGWRVMAEFLTGRFADHVRAWPFEQASDAYWQGGMA